MKYKNFFCIMFTLVIFSSISSLLAPIFIQVWKNDNITLSIPKIMLIIFLIVLSKLLTILFIIIREKFAKEFNKDNLIKYLNHIFNMDYDSIIDEGTINLLEKASISVNSIYTFMTTGCIQIYSSIIISIGCLILIAKINILLSLIMLIALPINYFGYKILNNNLKKKSKIMQEKTGKGFQEILSYVQEIDYIKQLPDKKIILNKLDNATENIYGSIADVNKYAGSISIILQSINEIIRTLLLLIVVYDYINNNGGIFAIILVTLVFPLYFQHLNIIVNANLEKRNFDIANEFETELINKAEKDGTLEINSINEIELNINNIKIKDIKLPFKAIGTFKKGDIIRINGSNGSGKSTFAKGMVKLRELPIVKLNGTNIENYKNSDIRKHIEYVVQNAPIVNGSLRKNLLLNLKEENITNLEQNPFIKSILEKKSLDDEILANGANLSGGEKQKISFARALLSNPDVLILDEICSNIDKESSDLIYKYLCDTRNERITFIISHDDLPENLINFSIN